MYIHSHKREDNSKLCDYQRYFNQSRRKLIKMKANLKTLVRGYKNSNLKVKLSKNSQLILGIILKF